MDAPELITRVKTMSSRATKNIFTSNTTNWVRFIELIVFALAVPVLGYWLFPSDPLGINAGFPWVVAAPIAFAARYGSAWGVGCALLAAFVTMSATEVYADQANALVLVSLSMIVLSVVVGDLSSVWRRRSFQAEAENQYLRHRLKEFSNDYHILKVSHGQLEEYMAGQRLSLRQAMQQLKPVLTTSAEGLKAGSELMAVFAQFCSVQVAGLYAMKSESVIDVDAIATHGAMNKLPVVDPLLQLAIRDRQLVSVKLESLAAEKNESRLLAAVPIADSAGHLHGVLAIKDMHFMAFQQENLNVLALLGGYIGDMLTRSKGLARNRSAWFVAELETALRFAQSHDVTSTLVCLRLTPTEKSHEVVKYISSNIRSLDASWTAPSSSNQPFVVLLLPLITSKQCHAYLSRLATSVTKKFDLSLQELLEASSMREISAVDSREVCLKYIRQQSAANPDRTDDPVSTDVERAA